MSKREDPLKNPWAYQEIWQEGVRKVQLAELLRQRRFLELLVQKNFPNILEMAKERGNAIDDPKALHDVLLKLIAAQTEEAARQILSK